MSALVSRRGILRGLFATPAIITASSLMPLRGLVMADEINVAEMIAALDRRLDAGHEGHWDAKTKTWKLAYAGDGVFVRFSGYDLLNHSMFAR